MRTSPLKGNFQDKLDGELDSLQERVQVLQSQAETLLGTFDEMERMLTNAAWSSRKMPAPKTGGQS